MIQTVKLETHGGINVLANIDKNGPCALTFANRTQAAKAMAKEELKNFICHITGYRPYFVVVRTWDECFNNCCTEFKQHLTNLAKANNKSLCQVYLWWIEYSKTCQNFDQSALLSEFEKWYEAKLKA